MSASTNKPSIAVIDYLRGIAALGVALYHVRVHLWVGWREISMHPDSYSVTDRAAAWLALPTPFLGSLVMLFFVISGFCVHLPQANARKPLVFASYFKRRFFRIYPPYLAAVLLSILILGLASGWTFVPVRSSLASILMIQNYTGGSMGRAAGQIADNPSLWSLPVEMELYLVYPIILLLLRRGSPGRILGMIGLVSVLAECAGRGGISWIIGNFARFWIIWCAGAWLAEKWSRGELKPPPGWLTLCALVSAAVSVVMDVRGLNWSIGNHTYGLFYFWLVWIGLTRPALWERWPSWLAKFFRWLGMISYSVYLIHFPCFFAAGVLWVWAFGGKPVSFLIPLSACLLILPVAWMFYRAIEWPSHKMAKRFAGVA